MDAAGVSTVLVGVVADAVVVGSLDAGEVDGWFWFDMVVVGMELKVCGGVVCLVGAGRGYTVHV